MGRPRKTRIVSLQSSEGWLTYSDIQVLLREYLGTGYGHKRWKQLVATGKVPAHYDPWGKRTRYRWAEIKAAIDKAITPITPIALE